MSIEIGQTAPDFSLYDSDKNKVTLSDLKGNTVLLLFYPQAFTSVCTEELCSIRDNIGQYQHSRARVFGISVDSIFTLAVFKKQQGYNFPLLSDFNKEVSGAYDSLYEHWNFDMRGVSKRSAFILDQEGVIRYAEVLQEAKLVPDFQKINEILANLA